MSSSDGDTTTDGFARCNVCGRKFEDDNALEHHVRDEGLLW